MIYGFHLSAQGAQAQSQRLEVIANNLANAGTTAFKKAMAVFQDNLPFDLEQGRQADVPGNLNASSGGVTLADVVTDYSQGPLQKTGAKLDVAIAGRGFLQVSDGKNQRLLTRDGRLALNAAGELVMQGTGHKLLSPDGEPIVLNPAAGSPLISSNGAISQGGAVVGQLALVSPAATARLQKTGEGLYAPSGPIQPAGTGVQLKQGYLEASGTNSVSEMLAMIQATRGFETNVNMIRHQDETMSRLLQSLPRR